MQFIGLRIGLRFKLLLLSAFLFTIPLLGYQYVQEMEKYLRIGQEKTLLGTVTAVATALHERPSLFDTQASFLPSVKEGRDLYAYNIDQAIHLDGNIGDWQMRQHSLTYGEEYVIEGKNHYQFDSLHFRHMVGKYRNYLYAFFQVTDDELVLRSKNALSVDNNDLLQIAFVTPDDEFKRYLISTRKEGWVTPFELDTQTSENKPVKPESRIQGVWKKTAQGYNIELRIPLALLGSQLSFAITDVDSNGNKLVLGTAPYTQPEQLGTVLVPSPEIERIVKGLGHTQSKIWVIDRHGRVLTTAGDIKNSSGLWSRLADNNEYDETWYSPVQEKLTQLYANILSAPPKDFVDELKDAVKLHGSHINKALTGNSAAAWRLSPDNKAVILSAAHPIYADGQVMGVVVAEETTNGIRTLRNQALEKWFNIILAVMGLGTLALFIFASRISSRIRALRNQTEQAIDDQGRIVNRIEAGKARDEIGDLQRSFAHMIEHLGQYTQYLQGMAARLSHELRTPVAVVRSSLESLQLSQPEIKDNVYLNRASEGVSRLSSILTLMSEATRLEQSLQNSEKQRYPIAEVVSGCVSGYQLTQPDQEFILSIDEEAKVDVNGSPELLAQMLDKLLANAVEFASWQTQISISLKATKSHIELVVGNSGELLPEHMQERLFDSMVSVRKSQKQDAPHLGLGLYIARLIAEFHGGSITLENRADNSGVEAKALFPL